MLACTAMLVLEATAGSAPGGSTGAASLSADGGPDPGPASDAGSLPAPALDAGSPRDAGPAPDAGSRPPAAIEKIPREFTRSKDDQELHVVINGGAPVRLPGEGMTDYPLTRLNKGALRIRLMGRRGDLMSIDQTTNGGVLTASLHCKAKLKDTSCQVVFLVTDPVQPHPEPNPDVPDNKKQPK